jgi:DNA-binding MurR/RpiR family transcriptional regulator
MISITQNSFTEFANFVNFFITAPTSEASYERKFSVLKRVIGNQRTKLSRKILERLVYLNR